MIGDQQYIVSARKYRPENFASMVGQEAVSSTLKAAVLTGKTAHAYLYCGPRGVGKTSMARIFAKTINCMDRSPDGEACNACESCRAFNEQRSPDIYELDAASNNSVENIRLLIEQVRILPQVGEYKIYIIDEVHMLSLSAFNAFLKTLEEPPEHVIFILATTEKHKILPTILSRCQIYDFRRISVTDITNYLHHVAKEEGITADEEALGLIAEKADGGMRDALSMFDRIANAGGGELSYQTVIDGLAILDYDNYFRLTDFFLGGDYRSVLLLLNDLLVRGFEAGLIVNGLAAFMRDLLMAQTPQTAVLLEKPATVAQRYVETAARCTPAFLYDSLRILTKCDEQYRRASGKRLLVELSLMNIAALSSHELRPAPAAATIKAANRDTNTTVQPNAAAAERIPKSAPVPEKSAPAPSASLPSAAPLGGADAPTGGRTNASGRLRLRKETAATPTTVGADVSREDLRTPFSLENAQQAWREYVHTIGKEEILLRVTMDQSIPEELDGETLVVKVYNAKQIETLEHHADSILPFLRSRLRNSHLTMQAKVTEQELNSLHDYSIDGKIKTLNRENPLFARFLDMFNLSPT